jgi:predicted small integral membrane protein
MRYLFPILLSLPSSALAQGWANVGKPPEDKGFSWTDPLFGGTWMAWTAATAAVFVGVFSAMALLTLIELKHPGGAERKGILGLVTTRGDRLFITLLGSVYIFLAWLGFVGQPVWVPLGASVVWGVFCFWKV